MGDHLFGISRGKMDNSRVEEEKLREAACYGDLDAVCTLIKKGVNINSQHNINGWTPLHWAAKRNHIDIAHFLLTNGANINAESFSKEKPADLTTSPALQNLLGSPTAKKDVNEEPEAPAIIPHYLSHPTPGHRVDLNDQPAKSVQMPKFTQLAIKEEIKPPKGVLNQYFFNLLLNYYTKSTLQF